MATNYLYEGSTMEYTAGATISAGDPVAVGNQIGIALDDAVSGDVITLAMEGVWTVPKVSAAVWAQGEKLTWDASEGAFDDGSATPATGDITVCCVAWSAGANAETTGEVKINVGVGTVA